MSWKTKIFEAELERINSSKVRELGEYIIENILPERFFIIPPSSTGKYHPKCTNRRGGLVIHTKRFIFLAIHLAEGCKLTTEEKDMMIVAGIVHDGAKDIKYRGKEYEDHPLIIVEWLKQVESTLLNLVSKMFLNDMYELIFFHMGPWTPKAIRKPMEEYKLKESIMYHSDYLSSRDYIGTPVDDIELKIPEDEEK